MPRRNVMPVLVHSNSYKGTTIHDQGAEFAKWRKGWRELGIDSTDASLDCDRLIARRLGIRVKDYWRQIGKIK